MKKLIIAAEDPSVLDENIDGLKDDFDYVIDGLEKLSRMGGDASKAALSISLDIGDMFEEYIEKISSEIIK